MFLLQTPVASHTAQDFLINALTEERLLLPKKYPQLIVRYCHHLPIFKAFVKGFLSSLKALWVSSAKAFFRGPCWDHLPIKFQVASKDFSKSTLKP